MRYEDRITIATPEGVDVELVLAGLGSRIAARVLDVAILGAITIVLGILSFLPAIAAGGEGWQWSLAVFGLLLFVVTFGYDIGFEVWGGGRTPGKRWLGIRVVRDGGQPVDLRSSAVRNVLRLVDEALTSYVAGLVAVFASSKNQRIGDMAAGTLVIRERKEMSTETWDVSATGGRTVESATWDVSAVTPEEVATLRRFLLRRADLDADARSRLANELVRRVRPKVVGAPERVEAEVFIEAVVDAKLARG